MKNILFVFLFVFSGSALFAQGVGIGIRAGDFNGLSIKKYSDKKALELSIGRVHMYTGKTFYSNRFSTWYIDQEFPYDAYEYTGFKGTLPMGIQLNYLVRRDIGSVLGEGTPGLEWYLGAGGQLRYQTYKFTYRYKYKGDPDWHSTNVNVRNLDLGPDGVVGLEYTFDEVPVSVFVDATLFVEIIDNPFLFWPQGCVGVRYNFSGSKASTL